LLPLHESWFEDDGESWVGWVASTIKPPTQILLKHFFSCFYSSVFIAKISLCKSAFVRLLLTHLLDHPVCEDLLTLFSENFVLLFFVFLASGPFCLYFLHFYQ
jgi:hypothetical protein